MEEPNKPSSFGIPHLIAVVIVIAFATICLWVSSRTPLTQDEIHYASPGPGATSGVAPSPARSLESPLTSHIAQIAVHREWVPPYDFLGPQYAHRLFLRLPFILFAMLFAGSIWYVAQRQFGHAGALIALALFCSSSHVIGAAARIAPDMLAAWGFFGVIYLGMASAHTLYATSEALPWHARWRRPVLMGIALGLAVAAKFSTVLALPLAVAFVLYLAPRRRLEGAGMMLLSTAIGAVILLGCYSFDVQAFGRDAKTAIAALTQHGAAAMGLVLVTNPASILLTIVALGIWVGIRRARWFGNTAPLIVVIAAAIAASFYSSVVALLIWLPVVAMVVMFIAGALSDLLETRRSKFVLAVVVLMVAADMAYGVMHVMLYVRSVAANF